MSNKHSSAIILAAGLGSRLRPLTDNTPKCLVNFLGKPIIVRMIEQLSLIEVKNITIVCGYCSEVLQNYCGKKLAGIDINYIENKDFASTNSMYSLWLARNELSKGCYLIEGDTVCDQGLFTSLSNLNPDNSYWAGQPYYGNIDGCVLTVEPQTMRIAKLEIERNPIPGPKQNQFKSTGILSLSADYGKTLSIWLDVDVEIGNVNLYYDLIIGKHLIDKSIHIYNIASEPWFEIDSVDDLIKAEQIFQK